MPNVYRKYDSKSGVWADFGDLKARQDIGIVEDTDIAEHSIASGQYVIWKGNLYTANSAITSGAGLSSSNLTVVSNGGLNKLNDIIKSQKINFAIINNENTTIQVTPGGAWYHPSCYQAGKTMIALAGFGVWYPDKMRITNIGINFDGTTNVFIYNSGNSNLTGFNIVGLYIYY